LYIVFFVDELSSQPTTYISLL
jgi:hypothetical protein